MRRVHLKMIKFGLAFIVVAGVGVFGMVYILGGMGVSRSAACCFDQD
jgi:hypothetical protein